MKKFVGVCLLGLALLVAPLSTYAGYVGGYTKANGTYVAPYYRSDANSTVTDNYSFYGNVNPYTGSVGTNKYYDNPSSPYYGGGSNNSSNTLSGLSGSSYVDSSNCVLSGFGNDCVKQPSYTPTYTYPTYTYTPTVTTKLTKYMPWIVIARADKYPDLECNNLGFNKADKSNCYKYREIKDDPNYEIVESDTISSDYVSCNGGESYYLLDSNGNPHVCEVAPVLSASVGTAMTAEQMMVLIAQLQAQIAAILAQRQLTL